MNDEALALRARWDTSGMLKPLHVTANEFVFNILIIVCLWDSTQQSKENNWEFDMQ